MNISRIQIFDFRYFTEVCKDKTVQFIFDICVYCDIRDIPTCVLNVCND